MDPTTVLLIAVGLAMDSFAVSISTGASARGDHTTHGLRMGVAFGSFQMIMPLLGWAGGMALVRYMSGLDHWVAFGLLAFVGGKMIYGSLKGDSCEEANPTKLSLLLVLAIATSIDALAVGLSFAFLKASIMVPILVIGGITFCLSLIGTFIGKRFGCILGNKAEIVGGLILMGIGIKILLQHMVPALPGQALMPMLGLCI